MSDELYGVLPATPLGRLAHIMHQHNDSALITAFVERWQPDTNTFHMPWGKMTIMLHDVQRILGVSIEGSLSAVPTEGDWKLALAGLFSEPMFELRRKGYFTSGTINFSETRTGMRPHPTLTSNAYKDEIAWGAVTLAYLYWQLGMVSRAGCKTVTCCLTLLQTWIYGYFPAFRPHLRQADMPNKMRAEMWST
ncbi:protein MAIN-LIKE 1-like [Amaranthus tricolor]|uniref:protein MAIN-LIKE 1-like n=1 Tax=Amaranthus tricolor TaxID=29722 RepID=UPI00258B8414|nr:protein MAIN-LIKE 1-like [Amaranthus tricolor]